VYWYYHGLFGLHIKEFSHWNLLTLPRLGTSPIMLWENRILQILNFFSTNVLLHSRNTLTNGVCYHYYHLRLFLILQFVLQLQNYFLMNPSRTQFLYEKFLNTKIHHPSLVDFLFEKETIFEFRESSFFRKYKNAIRQISYGVNVFDSDDLSLKMFTKMVKQNMLPLASNTQGFDAWIKDVSLHKTTRKFKVQSLILVPFFLLHG